LLLKIFIIDDEIIKEINLIFRVWTPENAIHGGICMRINHNLSSLNAWRNLTASNNSIMKKAEKLMSGLRINRAADDAAGLAISETMRSQIRGLSQASRNAQDAISLIQTAEGGLVEVHAMLHQMRERCVAAANGTYIFRDGMAIQKEIDQIKDEIDRIATTTQFNHKNLLDGTTGAIVSTDRTSTQVFIGSGVSMADPSKGLTTRTGEYQLEITASSPGQTQIQMSNIFMTRSDGTTPSEIATSSTKLKDIDKFWDNSDLFLLNNPQPVTILQGDGKEATIYLFGEDTIQDMVDKLNDAIADQLGQGAYVEPDDLDKFVSFVSTPDPTGVESVAGTLVFRTAIAGRNGEIKLASGEPIINAFGLSNIQESTRSQFTVNVTDSAGRTIVDNQVITDNVLIGAIHPNLDVKFDVNANITVSFNDTAKEFELTGDSSDPYLTKIRYSDNSLNFQIGPNEMHLMYAAIGNMDSEALGVNKVIATDKVSAGQSITIIDIAISKVSSQRASLGAVQNRLEHTINNLGVAGENLTASESRIRDTDMAGEMMEYVKFQTLLQSSQMMLAQANQQPESVLGLLSG
jgi:flagellin-like hook-associated protein FlgL